MRTVKCISVVSSALVLLLVNAAVADVDLVNGKDVRQELQVGGYATDATGSQYRIREYDGRSFQGLGIGNYNAYGYNRGVQFWVDANDLMMGGNESVEFRVSSNSILMRGSTSSLTHRLQPTPAVNPWVAEQLAGLTPPLTTVPGVSGDTFVDLSPGSTYYLDRRANELNLYINADANERVGIVTGWWQEQEHGQQQLEFRARQAAAVIGNRIRGSVALPIDRETNQASVGADVALGSNSVINYRYTHTRFSDHRSDFTSGTNLDFLPLNSITQIGSETNSQVVKARASINDRLMFTGVHINRNRTNARNAIPGGYNNAGGAFGKTLKISSTNLGMVYRATDDLSFTGKWRQLDSDNYVPPIYSGTSVVPSNPHMSTSTQSAEVEGVYTGIARTYLRFGYEKRESDREDAELQPGTLHLVLPFTGEEEDWDILRASVRYHPSTALNISGSVEDWSANTAGFTGTPNERTRTNLNATYMLRDNMAVYGTLSRWDEQNTQIRIADPASLPIPATDDASEADRIAAAGQGLDNQFDTANIGAWMAVNAKLSLNVDYGLVDNESSNWWVLGHDPTYLPHLPPQIVQFSSEDTQWSANANYAASRKLKLHAGFFRSKSDGASILDPTKFAGLGPEWTPFKVKQNRWSMGMSYGVSSKDTVKLDFSYGKWTDEVDAANSGTFELYRLAWARSF